MIGSYPPTDKRIVRRRDRACTRRNTSQYPIPAYAGPTSPRGAEKKLVPINVRAELHAVRVDLAQIVQAEHLKAAAVGQDRPLPPHESVEPAAGGHHLHARTQQQVVRVAKDDRSAQLFEIARLQGFDRRLCAHRHKDRRVHRAVSCPKPPQPRTRVSVFFQNLERAGCRHCFRCPCLHVARSKTQTHRRTKKKTPTCC